MNSNWLGFSLSPQVAAHYRHQQMSDAAADHISGAAAAASGVDDSSFAALEAFNNPSTQQQQQQHHHHHQGWNGMKDLGALNYSTTDADESVLVPTSPSCNSTTTSSHHHPKLENFLGGHSFTDHQSAAAFPPNSMRFPSSHEPQTATGGGVDGGGGGFSSSSSIGLSMIKTWLRNQPATSAAAAAQPAEDESGGGSGGGGHQTLSLSMSTGGSHVRSPQLLTGCGGGGCGESSPSDNDNNGNIKQRVPVDGGIGAAGVGGVIEAVPRKSIDTFGQRTSIYRGVTRHRWTGRYEAHLWDNSCRREGQTRKGRQVYLGGYDKEEKAARAYDLAALKYWGTTTTTNFPISNYEKELEEMKHMTRQEYVASLRRKSSGFSRGASIYRGVTRHHQHGRWQARIGRVAGNKDLYLGTFSTQEEAAEAYDIAAIKFRGLNAVTNFDMSRYDVKSILDSAALPIGGAAKRLKDAEQAEFMALDRQLRAGDDESLSNGIAHYSGGNGWPTIAFQQPQIQSNYSMQYPFFAQQRLWCKQEQDSLDSMGFQDLNNQLHLGANTFNFFNQPTSNHSLMSLESNSSIEQSSVSNSINMNMYGSSDSHNSGSFPGYMMEPALSVGMANEGNNHHQGGHGFGVTDVKPISYAEVTLGSSSDQCNGRNLYYLSQQSAGSTCNDSWVPTGIPTIAAQRSGAMAVCNAAPTFTVWNES